MQKLPGSVVAGHITGSVVAGFIVINKAIFILFSDSISLSVPFFYRAQKVTDATIQMFAVEVWKIKKKQGEREKSPSPLYIQEIKLSAVWTSIIRFAFLNLKYIFLPWFVRRFPHLQD